MDTHVNECQREAHISLHFNICIMSLSMCFQTKANYTIIIRIPAEKN